MYLNQINWGIIGCGDVTEKKSGPAFNQIEHSRLAAVMSRDAHKAKSYAFRHNVPKWYSSVNDLIKDPNVNAIYIATPPNVHAELSIMCLKVGKPVYVEKPMALNYAECQKMISVSKQTGCPLFVAYYRRSLAYFKTILNIINDNLIGEIIEIEMTLMKPHDVSLEFQNPKPWRYDPKISGGGLFYDLGSHQLDFISKIVGKYQSVKGHAENKTKIYDAEDKVKAKVLYENGVVLNGFWDFSDPKLSYTDRTIIYGSKGSICFGFFNFLPIELRCNNQYTSYPALRPTPIQKDFIQGIVNELRGNGISDNDVEAAAEVNKLMGEITQEYYLNIR